MTFLLKIDFIIFRRLSLFEEIFSVFCHRRRTFSHHLPIRCPNYIQRQKTSVFRCGTKRSYLIDLVEPRNRNPNQTPNFQTEPNRTKLNFGFSSDLGPFTKPKHLRRIWNSITKPQLSLWFFVPGCSLVHWFTCASSNIYKIHPRDLRPKL